jgi:alpha-glucoside transport system permease protein
LSWLNDWAHSTGAFGKLSFALVVAAAFLAVIGALLLLIDRTPKRGREKWQALLFLLPAFVLLLIGLIVPIFATGLSSVTDASGGFSGFKNFSWAFGDNQVRHAIFNTLKWVIIAPIAATVVGLAYAYAIDGVKGEAFAKALVFLPVAISFVGAAVIWKLMYQEPGLEPSGLLNVVLNWFGMKPLGFPTNSSNITYLLIVIMVWIQAGFATVVLSAAIKGVPAELMEAARIDGANAWQAFRKVTIPTIRPSLIVVIVTVSIATLKIFDLVKAFGAQQYGGDVLANKMYVTYQQAGLGSIGEHQSSALAMIIFILVIPFVAFQVRQMLQNRAVR